MRFFCLAMLYAVGFRPRVRRQYGSYKKNVGMLMPVPGRKRVD
jgi:hypothetical protein